MQFQSALPDVLFCVIPIYAAHSLEDEKTIADIQRYRKNMFELLINKQAEESLQLANIAILKYPKDISLLEFRAGLFEEKMNYRAAIADCKRIDAIPQNLSTISGIAQHQNNIYKLAQLQVKSGQFANALETINRVLDGETRVEPLSDYLKLKSEILRSLGNSEEASKIDLRAQRIQHYLIGPGTVDEDDDENAAANAAAIEQINEKKRTEILREILKLAKTAPSTVQDFQKQIPFKVWRRGTNLLVAAPTERWRRIELVVTPRNQRIISATLVPNFEYVYVPMESVRKTMGEPESIQQNQMHFRHMLLAGEVLNYKVDRYAVTFAFVDENNSNLNAKISWRTPEQTAVRKPDKAQIRELELAQKLKQPEVKDVPPLDGISEEAVKTWLSPGSKQVTAAPPPTASDEKMESFLNKAKVEISKNHPKAALELLIKARAAETEVDDSPRGFADLHKWVTLKSAYIELYKKQRLTDRVKYLETICTQQFKFDLGFVEGWPNLPPFPTLKEYNKDPWEVSVYETDAYIQKPNFIPVSTSRRPYLLRLQQLFGITPRDRVKKVEYIPPDLLDDIIFIPGTIEDDK